MAGTGFLSESVPLKYILVRNKIHSDKPQCLQFRVQFFSYQALEGMNFCHFGQIIIPGLARSQN